MVFIKRLQEDQKNDSSEGVHDTHIILILRAEIKQVNGNSVQALILRIY